MIPNFAKIFSYQINWRSRSHHAGYHRGAHGGLGVEFRGNVPLVDYPDARRIDINQTIRDPNEQVHVRIFNQKNATPIYAVCDLSASMQFRGHHEKNNEKAYEKAYVKIRGKARSKTALMAEIAASIAYSAYQASDTFSFIGFDNEVRQDWHSKVSYRMQDAYELCERLAYYKPTAVGSEGILLVNDYIGRARSLVFLISDFHMPLETIEAALNTLSGHHVVPVVLWNSAEYQSLPNFGLTTIIDAESGEQRTLFFRKALKKRFLEAFEQRKSDLSNLFMRYECPPFFVEDTFNAETISEYFHQFSAL